MPVDVSTQIEIRRPRHEVAGYASDPDNATAWYENIKSVEWKSPKPLAVGAEVAFNAAFLGRRMAYTYRIDEFVPDERLVMSTGDEPFPMETTYTWEDTPAGGTRNLETSGSADDVLAMGPLPSMERSLSSELWPRSSSSTTR
jgi:hypothetical protein